MDIVNKPLAIITLTMDNKDIFDTFDKTGAWYLPVIENEQYIGMLSKSKLLQQYRKMVVETSVD